ncbi:group II intron reverse transcriptase/maturase [Xenorhabdus koppenhoeferi]|uniref:HNH endonuclease n=1 Tax=Xenorhabdus koppenhoeferi TaxID=351659 RepID=UPI002B40E9EC|nr:group II intron reverse transcriptase/maturase [Xenorhabdus sp. Vera]
MSGDVHVRFRERLGGRFPGATRLLLGFSGPRHEAEEIKRAISQFLRDTLKLEISAEKTLITHARTEAARFLGYEVVTLDATTKQDHRGQRCINGAVRLKIPVDAIRQQCRKYMRNGKPSHRPERLYNDDYSIVAQYQAEYRGFVQYYLMGFNAHRLWNVHRVMRKSLLGTLANKHRTTVSRIVRRLRTEIAVGNQTIKALQIVRYRGQGKRPLVATFGGLSLAWQKDATITDNLRQVFNGLRSELISRLLAQTCECCGSTDGPFEVHHIRKLSDLNQWGRKEKPMWLRIMASRHRKTLVVCAECHQKIHRTRPVRYREI